MKATTASLFADAVQEALPMSVAAAYEAVPPVDFAAPIDDVAAYTSYRSPLGELLLIGDGQSITGLYMLPDQRYCPTISSDWRQDPGLFGDLKQQLDAYFAEELFAFDLPLAPRGTSFQRSVWQALTTIPYGHTTTYGALAVAVGRPAASRAVGMANGRNPISVVIPCHRVIGADGSLTGYGGGLSRKQRLLDMERSGPCGPPRVFRLAHLRDQEPTE